MNIDNLVQVLAQTHSLLQQQSNQAVNFSLVVRNWLFGYYIVEFEQQGEDRAQYGSRLLPKLADRLQILGVPSCSVSNLRNFRQFYQAYPEIHQTLSGESLDRLPLTELSQKPNPPPAESVNSLTTVNSPIAPRPATRETCPQVAPKAIDGF